MSIITQLHNLLRRPTSREAEPVRTDIHYFRLPSDARIPVTPVPGWDLLEPRSPMTAILQAGNEEFVRQQITALYRAGALDGANGDVLDRVVHDMTLQWREQAFQAHLNAVKVLNLILEQGLQHQHRLAQRITRLREERDAAMSDYADARSVLTGRWPRLSDIARPVGPADIDGIAVPAAARPAPPPHRLPHADWADDRAPAANDAAPADEEDRGGEDPGTGRLAPAA